MDETTSISHRLIDFLARSEMPPIASSRVPSGSDPPGIGQRMSRAVSATVRGRPTRCEGAGPEAMLSAIFRCLRWLKRVWSAATQLPPHLEAWMGGLGRPLVENGKMGTPPPLGRLSGFWMEGSGWRVLQAAGDRGKVASSFSTMPSIVVVEHRKRLLVYLRRART